MTADAGRSSLRGLRADLRAAWVRHRLSVAFSAVLLLGSIPAGAYFRQQGRRISAFPLSGTTTIIFPRDRPALTLLTDNLELFSLLVLGVFSAGLLTAIGLVTQGIVAGYYLAFSLGEYGAGTLLITVVLHNLFVFGSFVLAGAVAFRLVAHTVGRFAGTTRPLDIAQWRQSGLLFLCALFLLVIGAVIEAWVTFALSELFL